MVTQYHPRQYPGRFRLPEQSQSAGLPLNLSGGSPVCPCPARPIAPKYVTTTGQRLNSKSAPVQNAMARRLILDEGDQADTCNRCGSHLSSRGGVGGEVLSVIRCARSARRQGSRAQRPRVLLQVLNLVRNLDGGDASPTPFCQTAVDSICCPRSGERRGLVRCHTTYPSLRSQC